jgi:hypothetical protein
MIITSHGSEELIFDRVLAYEGTPDDDQLGPKYVVKKENVQINFCRLHCDGNVKSLCTKHREDILLSQQ